MRQHQLNMDLKSGDHQYWDKRAVKLDNLSWVNDDALLAGILKAAKNVGPQTRVMDIGTGTGKVLKGFRALYPDIELAGVDICSNMIRQIDPKYRFHLFHRDVYKLDGIRDNYYDIVTARMIFHHLFKPQPAMAEINRILKPGGQCILCEGNPPDIHSRQWYTEMFRYKEERITLMESDLINILLNAGMEEVVSYTIVLRNMSIMNWLKNSTINGEDHNTIVNMHREAPEHVKDAYNMTFTDSDIFMDWKFTVTSGVKPQ